MSGDTPQAHVPGFWRRQSAAAFRWLHIYLSMVSFGILFFFAVTGLTLNHADWFAGRKEQVRSERGTMTAEWVKPGATIAKLEVVEFLRRHHGIKGLVGEFRIEDDHCDVAFKGPGYSADVNVRRDTGAFELTETRMGAVAVINDLHKGRDSGTGWSVVIDFSAVLMILVSVTGAVLLLYLKRRRLSGYVVAVAGTVVAWLLYVWLVP